MTNPSSYPSPDELEEPRSEATTSWGGRAAVAVVVAVVLLIVVLHLSGTVGPAAH